MHLTAVNLLPHRTDVDVDVDVDGRATLSPASGPPAPGIYISPGWIDIQVNGFAGFDINAPAAQPEDAASMVRRLWQEGVAQCCPTIVTQSAEHIERCVRAVASACEQDACVRASVLGIHLEGPYISPVDGARGAHLRDFVRPPDWDEFQRWQETAGGRIKIVTLAPEVPGAIPFIRKLVESGVVAGLGHTLMSASDLAAAVDAGAALSTHLGNGAPAMLPRHPNFIWDQLAEDRLVGSAIFDGHHLPASVMRVIVRAKGIGRTVLVSDAVALARMPPGVYENAIGGKVELHANGRLSVYGTPYLAGSASSLKDCLENAVGMAGCTLQDAVQMATMNPAGLLTVPPGSKTAVAYTLFRWDGWRAAILATVIGGQAVYAAE